MIFGYTSSTISYNTISVYLSLPRSLPLLPALLSSLSPSLLSLSYQVYTSPFLQLNVPRSLLSHTHSAPPPPHHSTPPPATPSFHLLLVMSVGAQLHARVGPPIDANYRRRPVVVESSPRVANREMSARRIPRHVGLVTVRAIFKQYRTIRGGWAGGWVGGRVGVGCARRMTVPRQPEVVQLSLPMARHHRCITLYKYHVPVSRTRVLVKLT